jgi:hypothetical protein
MPIVVPSAALVAVISTGFCSGGVAGAVYRPADVMIPAVALPPTAPPADHVTTLLERPLTWAANWIFPLTTTEGDKGATMTL